MSGWPGTATSWWPTRTSRTATRWQGPPVDSPSVMVRALLLATHDKTSDVESARRSRVDLDWRAALGWVTRLLGSARPRSARFVRGWCCTTLTGRCSPERSSVRSSWGAQGGGDRDHRLLPGDRGGGGGRHLHPCPAVHPPAGRRADSAAAEGAGVGGADPGGQAEDRLA